MVYIIRNGGKIWENVILKGMFEWMMINSIEFFWFDVGMCYIVGIKYKIGDFVLYLYKIIDYGKIWKKIINGILVEYFIRVFWEDEF